MAKEEPKFKQLEEKLADGYNLHILGPSPILLNSTRTMCCSHHSCALICHFVLTSGFDAYYEGVQYKPDENVADVLFGHYLDDTRPFGHELVLYSLLMLHEEGTYPWNR